MTSLLGLTRLKYSLLAVLIISAVFFTISSIATASDSLQEEGNTFVVLTGFEDPAEDGLEVEAFLPENLTIKEGDSVEWLFTAIEPHTVTFLSGAERPGEFVELPDGRLAENPQIAFPSGGNIYDGTGFVSSGVVNTLPGNDLTYSLSFDTVGTFAYVCLIHPFQTGTVTVLPETAPPVFPPDIVTGNGEVEKDNFVQEMIDLRVEVGPDEPTVGSGGLREYEVLAGISTQKVDLMFFDEPDLNIGQGETVTWSWEATGAPHNVMFLPEGQDPPPFIIPEPQEAGPPNLLINSVVLDPAGGDVYEPDTLLNSGLRLNENVPPPPGFTSGATYSLTFPEQGTFTYICSLHVGQGMIGTITVGPFIPAAPSVGDTTLSRLTLGLLGAIGMALILSGGFLTRRRVSQKV